MSWLFLFLWVRFPTLCFGKPKQEPIGAIRERSGETYRTKAAGRVPQTPLTDAEKQLLT
jgi:hypothetical protein